MSRSALINLVIAVVVIFAAVVGYRYYEERRQAQGVQINVGPGGISIEKK